jgi:hypothetical protein
MRAVKERRASASRPGKRATAVGVDAGEVVHCLRRLFKGLHEHSKAMQRQAG